MDTTDGMRFVVFSWRPRERKCIPVKCTRFQFTLQYVVLYYETYLERRSSFPRKNATEVFLAVVPKASGQHPCLHLTVLCLHRFAQQNAIFWGVTKSFSTIFEILRIRPIISCFVVNFLPFRPTTVNWIIHRENNQTTILQEHYFARLKVGIWRKFTVGKAPSDWAFLLHSLLKWTVISCSDFRDYTDKSVIQRPPTWRVASENRTWIIVITEALAATFDWMPSFLNSRNSFSTT